MTRLLQRVLLAFCLLAPDAAAAHAEDTSAELTRLEHAVARHGYTPERLLQLGQAQRAHGQLGAAVASFERGLLLAPRDRQLQAALHDTRAAAGLTAPATTPLARAAHLLSLREWSWLALGAISLLSVATVLATLARRLRRAHVVALLAAAALGVVAFAGVAITRRDLQRACILADDTPLRRSPVAGVEPVLQLRAGETVRMHEAHDGFVYVETSDGTGGWLRRELLAPLAASAPAA